MQIDCSILDSDLDLLKIILKMELDQTLLSLRALKEGESLFLFGFTTTSKGNINPSPLILWIYDIGSLYFIID